MDKARKRLSQMHEAGEIVLADVSRAIGRNHAYLQQFISRGVPKKLSLADLIAVSREIGVPVSQLTDDAVAPDATLVGAAVVGGVKAGLWMEFDDGFNQDTETVPSVPGKWQAVKQFAYRVSGNSMDRARMHEGDYVICVPYADARTAIRSGDYVVVERRRGGAVERTVKLVSVGASEYRLEPRSSDARYSAIVVPHGSSTAEDGSEIEIVGLVIGVFAPVGA